MCHLLAAMDPAPRVDVERQEAERLAGVGALVVAESDGKRARQSGDRGHHDRVRRRIVSYGPEEKVVAQNVDATDLAITAKGEICYTDAVHKTIGHVNGKAYPAGIALSPDHAMLIVTDAQGRHSCSFQIAADGSLVNGEPFYRLEMPETGWMSGVRSVAGDSIGQVCFASAVGIQVCEANGRVAQILNASEYGAVSSIAFAGSEMNWLYAAEGGKLFRRPVKVKGVPVWAPAKLPKPPFGMTTRPALSSVTGRIHDATKEWVEPFVKWHSTSHFGDANRGQS